MREILFRGKPRNLKSYEWVHGCLMHHQDGISKIYSNELDHPVGVIPESVSEFTGLTDKNGKKIFENDIVNIENRKYRVSFEKGCWVILGKSEFCDFLQTNAKRLEIAGNVYDNPELLGGE